MLQNNLPWVVINVIIVADLYHSLQLAFKGLRAAQILTTIGKNNSLIFISFHAIII